MQCFDRREMAGPRRGDEIRVIRLVMANERAAGTSSGQADAPDMRDPEGNRGGFCGVDERSSA